MGHLAGLTKSLPTYLNVMVCYMISQPPVCLFAVCPFVHLPILCTVHPSVCCLSVFLSICASDHLSVCLSVYLTTFLSICLSVHPSVCLSVRLSVLVQARALLGIYLQLNNQEKETCNQRHYFVTSSECWVHLRYLRQLFVHSITFISISDGKILA